MSVQTGQVKRHSARLAGRAETIRRLWKQNRQTRDFAEDCLIDAGELRGAIFRLAQQALTLDKRELQKLADIKAIADKVWGFAPADSQRELPL